MEKMNNITIYTKEEIKRTFKTIDSLDDLIIRCYLEELEIEGKREPNVHYVFEKVKDYINRKAYDITIGLDIKDVSIEYVSDFLIANKFAHCYGAIEVITTYGKILSTTQASKLIAKIRNESEDKYALFDDGKSYMSGLDSLKGLR